MVNPRDIAGERKKKKKKKKCLTVTWKFSVMVGSLLCVFGFM